MRHVIRTPQGLYYTEMRCAETVEHRKDDGTLLGIDNRYRPAFESFKPETASQLNTKADAERLMADPQYGGNVPWNWPASSPGSDGAPGSFAGCEVVSYSTDAKE